MVIVKLTIRPH